MKKFRVYDVRTNKTIYESEYKWQAQMFLEANYDEDHMDFNHVRLEEVSA